MTKLVRDNIEVIAHQTAKEGKSFCGDGYYFTATDEYFVCVLADGLGSGEFAYEASSAVIGVVEEHHEKDVDAIMKLCNEVLMQKRGAAVALFKVHFATREFVYSCVGNIRFFLYSSTGKLTYPLPVTGYLSGRPQVFHTQRFTYEADSKFLIYSDGLNIQGVKSLLKAFLPIDLISEDIKKQYPSTADDATFILGSLL
ncbi:SpoIIE family protein phosphatase [Bacillus sp. ISL-47]|uniref:PP2C family serine/threonine-protein phosphatase n=1 Tax=Bacillus sp. ISL-47 TaxID=2819130 RepID=UPI001BEA91E5|nr:PP2C family serine/threonine-protein phosphatase [Bacillus sp. ISL-47]MBT2691375.1 SpoIIE family protein phosphatase [Bacillus sp. ISL-47]MBT2709726.1 SpoIIE family protein phosphatase [Pseudomonas sp. ISL-84]